MQISDEEYYLLALSLVDGIGSVRAQKLLKHFNSARNIFQADARELKANSGSVPVKVLDQILAKDVLKSADREITFCRRQHVEILSILSPDFPIRLKTMEDFPLVLYKKGDIFPKIRKTISIVGTRKSTDYGHRFLDGLFEDLNAVKEIVVISGLAHGIDYKAHSLALYHRMNTTAVMGLALDKIYPTVNTNLAQNILKQGGGWLTETSSKSVTTQGVFPQRNRLIAGMADVVLVVETDLKGGSVITAKLARDYHRRVFALPGRIGDSQSRGCNDLIQKGIAQLINSPLDLINEMHWSDAAHGNTPRVIEIDFAGSTIQKRILETIGMQPKIDMEQLLHKAQTDHSQLVEALLELELEGWIRSLPGNQYELI